MNSAREKILSQIRHSLPKDSSSHFIEKPILPKLPENLVQLFIEKSQSALASVEIIEKLTQVPEKVETFLNKKKLRIIDSPLLKKLRWSILCETGACLSTDYASLTVAFCGVAETGTVVLLSGAKSPTTLNFLPEIHIVLLNVNKIVSHYEKAWDLIRQEKKLPRTVNFITGPSRTGDIEQTLQVGIHGPKQLHIVLLQEDFTDEY